MAINIGISSRFYLENLKFKTSKGLKISKIDGQDIEALPPVIANSTGSAAIGIMQSPFMQFAFNHIDTPDYGGQGCIARVTGQPINKPDFIADFHFISLARSIDYLLQHNAYQGKIIGNYNTPGANK